MRLILTICSLALLVACNGTRQVAAPSIVVPDADSHHASARPWTSLAVLDGPERFHFAVVTDRTGGERPGIFSLGVEKVNLVQPAFVMSVGDLIQSYTKDAGQIESEWDEFEGLVTGLDAPFFFVAGNHDMMNEETEAAWTARLGASYYHFLYKGALFLVLNSELFDLSDIGGRSADITHGPGHDEWAGTAAHRRAQAAQMAYAERVLGENADARWTFVFIHKPYWRESFVRPPRDEQTGEYILDGYGEDGRYPTNLEVTGDWARLQQWLGERDYTAFAGHRHVYAYEDLSDADHTHEHISLATTGGVSQLRGLSYGEFDQFLWVTMTADGPVFANLTLDGVQPKDLAMPDARPWWVE